MGCGASKKTVEIQKDGAEAPAGAPLDDGAAKSEVGISAVEGVGTVVVGGGAAALKRSATTGAKVVEGGIDVLDDAAEMAIERATEAAAAAASLAESFADAASEKSALVMQAMWRGRQGRAAADKEYVKQARRGAASHRRRARASRCPKLLPRAPSTPRQHRNSRLRAAACVPDPRDTKRQDQAELGGARDEGQSVHAVEGARQGRLRRGVEGDGQG